MPKKKHVPVKDDKPDNRSTQVEATETSEKLPERSFLMLAFSLIASPKDACEEIIRRNLFIPGLCILLLFGLINTVITCIYFYYYKMNSLFELAANNPLVIVGTFVTIAWFIDKGAQFLQAERRYLDTLTIIAWGSLPLCIGKLLGQIPGLGLINLLASLWMLAIFVIGIQQIYKFNLWKSLALCIFAGITFYIITQDVLPTYLLQANHHKIITTLPSFAALTIPSYLATSWVAAAALVIFVLMIRRSSDNNFIKLQTLMTVLAAIGVITTVISTAYIQTIDPINDIAKGAAAYNNPDNPDPERAAKRFAKVLNYTPSDYFVQLYLAQSLLAEGDRVEAEKVYKEISVNLSKYRNDSIFKIACTTGIGTVRYIEGNFTEARKHFEKAATIPKDYPTAVTRLALTELRLGKPAEAIKAATDAVDAGDDSILPQIVLAQAYTVTKDTKNAEKAIAEARKINKDVAERLSYSPDGWSKAIDWLTPVDLRLPLRLPKMTYTKKN